MKEKFNLNDIIFQAYADRPMSDEVKKQLDIVAEKTDKLMDYLDEKNKELFRQYEMDVIELNAIYQEELIDFLLEFIRTFFNK